MKNFEDYFFTALDKYVKTIHDGNIRNAQKALGIKESSGILYKWLNKERYPNIKLVSKIIDKIGLEYNYADKIDENSDNFCFINKVEAKAGAGSSLLTSGEVIGKYAFRKDFFAMQHISAKSVLLDVMGDSMEPLIYDGDTILVDESDKEARNDQIYLISLEEELMVKRLIKIPQGWQIHSENERVKDIDLIGNELEYLRVIGRVRWFGRVL